MQHADSKAQPLISKWVGPPLGTPIGVKGKGGSPDVLAGREGLEGGSEGLGTDGAKVHLGHLRRGRSL